MLYNIAMGDHNRGQHQLQQLQGQPCIIDQLPRPSYQCFFVFINGEKGDYRGGCLPLLIVKEQRKEEKMECFQRQDRKRPISQLSVHENLHILKPSKQSNLRKKEAAIVC